MNFGLRSYAVKVGLKRISPEQTMKLSMATFEHVQKVFFPFDDTHDAKFHAGRITRRNDFHFVEPVQKCKKHPQVSFWV
jgi:hypothetical protein